MLLGGVDGQAIAERAGDVVAEAEAFFFRLVDLLRSGDPATWAAAVFVAVFVVLLVGLWRGTISIGRKG